MRPSTGLVLALLSYTTTAVLALPIDNGATSGDTLEIIPDSNLFERNEAGDDLAARSIEEYTDAALDSRTSEFLESNSEEFTREDGSEYELPVDARGLPLGAIAKLAKAAVAPARKLKSALSRAGSGKPTSVKAKSSKKASGAKSAKGRSSKKSVGAAKKATSKPKKGSKAKKAAVSGKKSGRSKTGSGKKTDKKDGKGKGSGKKGDGKGKKPKFSRVRNLNFNVDPGTIVTAGTGIAMLMN